MTKSRGTFSESPSYKWWVLAVVQFSFMLIGVDSTIVNLALPTIARDLGADIAVAQWTIAAFFTTTAVVLPMAGRLADVMGLKKVFLMGFVIFTASSVGCGLAPSLEVLIGMRVVQAVGAAALLANSNVISLGVFPPNQHALAMGVNGSIFSLGFALGYTLGGFFIQWFGWRSIFLVNLPIGLLAISLGALVLVESKIRRVSPPKVPFDWAGAVLSVVALTLVMVSLDGLTRGPQVSGGLLIILLAGLVGVGSFFLVEMKNKHPLLDVQLFRNPPFSIGLVTRLMSNAVFTATAFAIPFYTQNVLNFTPIESGLMMVPFAVTFAVAGPLSGRAADRIGSRALTTAGFVSTGAALIVLGALTAEPGHERNLVIQVAIGMALLGLGSGLFISPNSSVTLDAVPADKTGAASGLLYFTAFLGSATGTAYAASVLSAGLRDHGGLTALHSQGTREIGVASFLHAQGFVFHSLIAVTVLAIILCLSRGSHSKNGGSASTSPFH